jgi:hypothetical protein
VKLVEDGLHRFNYEATRTPYTRQPVTLFFEGRHRCDQTRTDRQYFR